MNTLFKPKNVYILTTLLIMLNLASAVFYPIHLLDPPIEIHVASILLVGGFVLYWLHYKNLTETILEFRGAPRTVLTSVMFIGSVFIVWYFIFPVPLAILLVIIVVVAIIFKAIMIIEDHLEKK